MGTDIVTEAAASFSSYHSRFTTGEFFLEKYIRVTDKNGMGIDIALPDVIVNRGEHLNGVVNIDDWKEWLTSISGEYGDNKLSEFFGNLEFTYATDAEGNLTDEVTGIDGEMGIRYGLRLSYVPPASCATSFSNFWNGSALHEGLKNTENWSVIEAACMREKAWYLPPARIGHDGLSVEDAVVTDDEGNIIDISILTADSAAYINDRLTDGVQERDPNYEIDSSRYIIPLVSAEYDALDHTIADHINNINSEMDLYCLGKDLISQPEFEMLFQYVFPLNRITSLMGIYTGMGFLMSIGEKVMELDLSDMSVVLEGGIPKPDTTTGEWQIYPIRRSLTRGGRSFDGWDFEQLFPATKRSLIQMFRSYFKSREFMSHKDDEDKHTETSPAEKARFDVRSLFKKKKKGKRGARKARKRRRDRPFDKNGN